MATKIQHAHERSKNFFGGNREAAIQRDGERCVHCGMSRQEHRDSFGRDITVDHIDGHGRNYPKEQKNNDLSNLQTLCAPCHGKKDRAVSNHARIVKLTEEDVRDIKMFARAGMSFWNIQKAYRMVATTTIQSITAGRSWKWVKDKV